jgi:hypothetical protein
MKKLRFIMVLSSIVLTMWGCKKEEYTDTSFLNEMSTPSNLGMLFEITQDNSGNVTIIPTSEGASYYHIYFGDTATIPGKVDAGKVLVRKYAEGTYNVKLVAYSASGKSAEFNKSLTVTFKAPESLELTVTPDASNNFKIVVTAKALYETSFKIYFGEDSTETPVSFNEGDTVSHVYAKVGTYKMKLQALGGGTAITELLKNIVVEDPILLPINFESATLNYKFTDFDGGAVTVISNPSKSGINTSNKVGQMVKSAGQVWGGSLIELSKPINFVDGKIFKLKVYSPRVGAKVLLKVENKTNSSISYEKEVSTTVANAWQELLFDYSAIDATKDYHKIVLIFDLGTMGNGSADYTFLFDDINLSGSLPLNLPMNFESTLVDYSFTPFDGGAVSTATNPSKSGINLSDKVGKMLKSSGQTWGGSFATLASPMAFTGTKTFKMKVYSPKIGAKVLLKVENLTDGSINYEKEVATTTINAWEQLSFDFSAINTSNSYQKVILIFENGTMGDGSANFTYYFDDIELN